MGLFNRSVDIDSFKATNTNDVTTTSSSYVLIANMTITPGAGTFLAMFSARGVGTDLNQELTYALHINTTIVAASERDQNMASTFPTNLEENLLHTQETITLAAGESINVRFKTDLGTFHVHQRSLILVLIKS